MLAYVVDQQDEKTMHELINLVLEVYKLMKIELWLDVIP